MSIGIPPTARVDGAPPRTCGKMRRMRALSELRVLWWTLVLLGVAEVWLHPHVFRPHASSLAALEGWSAETPDAAPADVLLIGSSRFRPLDAQTIGQATGLGLRVVNGSFNGGTWEATARLLDRYAPDERLERGPRLVLIGSGVMDVNDGFQNALVSAQLWTPRDLFAHVWESGTDAHTRAYLFSVPPASTSALATAYQKKLLRAEIRDVALGLMARRGADATGEAGLGDEAVERDVLDNAEAQKAARGVQRLADIPPPVGGPYVRNFHVGGRQTEALRGLVARLRAAGVVPVLVDAPLSDWYRSGMIHGEEAAYLDLLRREGAALDVPVFVLPREAWGLAEADYFVVEGRFDGHHIASAEGRRRFAEGLGRLVVAPLWARLKAGATPGFADSRVEPRP